MFPALGLAEFIFNQIERLEKMAEVMQTWSNLW